MILRDRKTYFLYSNVKYKKQVIHCLWLLSSVFMCPLLRVTSTLLTRIHHLGSLSGTDPLSTGLSSLHHVAITPSCQLGLLAASPNRKAGGQHSENSHARGVLTRTLCSLRTSGLLHILLCLESGYDHAHTKGPGSLPCVLVITVLRRPEHCWHLQLWP